MMKENLADLVAVARGDRPADLLLTDARIINVFSGEIETGNVAVCGGRIAGIGDYEKGEEIIDLEGKYVAPGLIDGHTHIESSMLDIGQYARAVVPHGTLGIITDLHEIANAAGISGVDYILKSSRNLPLDIFVMAPSCVPATHLETSGANLDAAAIKSLLKRRGVIGLGEIMNFPGVIGGDSGVLAKISLAGDRPVDGHAPGVGGKNLNAYIAAGIRSDHESVAYDEAREKLRRGMYVMIREGSSEKNLEALLPLVTDETCRRCLFVVDDRSCSDLLKDGDVDAIVRKAISLGLPPVRAVQLATINAAERFGLKDIGALTPGYFANMIVLDDLERFDIDMVFYRGCRVARSGKPQFGAGRRGKPGLSDTFDIKPFGIERLKIPAHPGKVPVIEVVPGQIITRKRMEEAASRDGVIVSDTGRDILKLVVVERHHATGNIGLGLIKGFGLKSGALASSVAHDSHNIVAVGVTDEDIYAAVKEVEKMGGGLAVAADGRVLGSLALPIAGLLSPEPVAAVAGKLEKLESLAGELGTKLSAPFATLSFMALPVIPELRLTDLGLVDVNTFSLIKI
jgi:adenine deaminase